MTLAYHHQRSSSSSMVRRSVSSSEGGWAASDFDSDDGASDAEEPLAVQERRARESLRQSYSRRDRSADRSARWAYSGGGGGGDDDDTSFRGGPDPLRNSSHTASSNLERSRSSHAMLSTFGRSLSAGRSSLRLKADDYSGDEDDRSLVSAGVESARRRLEQQQQNARRLSNQKKAGAAGKGKAGEALSLGDFLNKDRDDDSDGVAGSGEDEEDSDDDATFFSMFQWSQNDEAKKKTAFSSSKSVGAFSYNGRASSQPRVRPVRGSASVVGDYRSKSLAQSHSEDEADARPPLLRRNTTAPVRSKAEVDRSARESRSKFGVLDREASQRFDDFLDKIKEKEKGSSRRLSRSSRDPDRDHKKKSSSRKERGEGGERRKSSRREEGRDRRRSDGTGSRRRTNTHDGEEERGSRRRTSTIDGEEERESRRRTSANNGDEDRESRRRTSANDGAEDKESRRRTSTNDGDKGRRRRTSASNGDKDRERRRSDRRRNTADEGEDKERRRSSTDGTDDKEKRSERRKSSRRLKDSEGVEDRRSSRRSKSRHRRRGEDERRESSRRRESKSLRESGSSHKSSKRLSSKSNQGSSELSESAKRTQIVEENYETGNESECTSQWESQADDDSDDGEDHVGKSQDSYDSDVILQFNPTTDGNVDQIVARAGPPFEIDHANGTRTYANISEMPFSESSQSPLCDPITTALTLSNEQDERVGMRQRIMNGGRRLRRSMSRARVRSLSRPRVKNEEECHDECRSDKRSPSLFRPRIRTADGVDDSLGISDHSATRLVSSDRNKDLSKSDHPPSRTRSMMTDSKSLKPARGRSSTCDGELLEIGGRRSASSGRRR